MIDQDFIRRAEELLKNDVEEYLERRRKMISEWNHKNRELLRRCIAKYSKTEKGRKACQKRYENRMKRHKELMDKMSKTEKKEFRFFCLNRPKGYEVDHIIPISLGGTHHRDNLQYLTREAHIEKHRVQTQHII